VKRVSSGLGRALLLQARRAAALIRRTKAGCPRLRDVPAASAAACANTLIAGVAVLRGTDETAPARKARTTPTAREAVARSLRRRYAPTGCLGSQRRRRPADRFYGGSQSPSFQNSRRTTLNSRSRVGRHAVDNFGDDRYNPLLQLAFGISALLGRRSRYPPVTEGRYLTVARSPASMVPASSPPKP
jgi:hypothetical protein